MLFAAGLFDKDNATRRTFLLLLGLVVANLRAFGWQSKKADEQRGKEIARQPPAKMLK
jgi:hypothetical protein